MRNQHEPRRPALPLLESLEDRTLLSAYVVDRLTDAGEGSGLAGDLRYCLTRAQNGDGIRFGDGVQGVVNLTRALPDLTDGSATLPDAYHFTTADAGSHSFAGGVTFFQSGAQTLTATGGANPTLTASATVTVQGRVAYFDVTWVDPVTAGEAFQLTVTARDASGQVVTGYRGQIGLFSLFGEDDLREGYVFTAADAGSHTFSVTLYDPGVVGILVADTDALVLGFAAITVQPAG